MNTAGSLFTLHAGLWPVIQNTVFCAHNKLDAHNSQQFWMVNKNQQI